MTAEIESYRQQLDWILNQLVASTAGLTATQLNWRPPTGSANSAYAIVSHVVASTRVYALGFGCGLPVHRDRDAEFAAAGDDCDVLAGEVRQVAADVAAALSALPAAKLDERITPSQEAWGTGTPHEISRRDAIVESIRHAAIHLGELRLTRDLVLGRG